MLTSNIFYYDIEIGCENSYIFLVLVQTAEILVFGIWIGWIHLSVAPSLAHLFALSKNNTSLSVF